jgi:predicted nucleic acid-binding Zn ribbon protein
VDGDHTEQQIRQNLGVQAENATFTGGAAPSDLVAQALADARGLTRSGPGSGRGGGRGQRQRRPGRRGEPGGDARTAGGYSGPAPDDTDPRLVGDVLAGYVTDRGWERPLSEARIFADWAGVVGADVAAHSAPASLTAGELRVTAESTAWATQLRMLSSTLLARLAAELGPDVVRTIHITGPTGPNWKHGPLSVRGARGPRDTYG